MVIRFLCPNGHQIHCSEDRAGKAAKCPKCGVKFQIPEVSDIDVSGSSESLLAVSDSGASLPPVGPGPVEPAEEQIEFLCPNGHHLQGPASLQGQPGQCPECGANFRVPTYEEEEQAKGTTQQINVTGVTDDDNPGITLDVAGRPPVDLFLKLWAEKSHDAVIELHFSDGQTIVPDHFAEKLSQGSHGVFGTQESDGTLTLVAVAWESITRMIARGVKRLPDEMWP